MRIRVRRVGGFAGNVALAAELETAQLPASDASRVEAAVVGLPWGLEAGPPPYPDAFRYEVDLPDEPDRGTAVLEEGHLDGDLEVLSERLKSDGVIESSRRPRS